MNFEGLSNVTQHHFNESVAIYEKYPNMMQHKREKMNSIELYWHQGKAFYEVTKNQLQNVELKKKIEGSEKFDLVIVECIMCPLLSLGNVLKCPVVKIIGAEALSYIHEQFGNDVNPSKYCESFLPYRHHHLNFLQKIHSWAMYFVEKVLMKSIYFMLNSDLKEINEKSEKGVNRLSLLLVNTNPHFGHVRAIMPNTKQIGFAHVDPPKSLDDKKLKEFLDASDSVIVCFGTIAKTSQTGSETVEKFLKTFAKFPNLNFVWKLDKKIENLPKNVKTLRALKLADALAHPNVKLLISHGGFSSAYEAIDREVPMIVFPLSYDHSFNAKMMIANGIALELDLNSFTAEEFEEKISKALNGTFKENVRKLKKIVNDVPMKPFDVAMESIEFVLRNPKNFYVTKDEDPSTIMTLFVFITTVFVGKKLLK